MPNEIELQKQVDKLKKDKLRLKRWVSLLAFALVAIAVIYIYNQLADFKQKFRGANPDSTANPHMGNYRNGLHRPGRSMGVYYSPDDLRKYLDTYFPELIKKQIEYQPTRPGQNKPDSFHYHRYAWMIGFYWMKKERKRPLGPNRLDFYVIPTLVDTTRKDTIDLIDYYDDKKRIYYHGKNVVTNARPTTDDAVAYDEGQLWP
jgi:hypothetical protein